MIKRTVIVTTARDYHFVAAKTAIRDYVVRPPVYDTM